MKYVLLFMWVLMVRSMWKSIKTMFVSSETLGYQFEEALKNTLRETDNDEELMKATISILTTVTLVFNVAFLIMSSVYVANLFFAMLGALLILQTFRAWMAMFTYIMSEDRDYRNLDSSKIIGILSLVYRIVFIIYLIATWYTR